MWEINYSVSKLVARHRGTLPVLLTCPHGGIAEVPGVSPRSGDRTPTGCNFEDAGDVDTIAVTTATAQRMLEIFGEAPYVVIAQYHRKYLDANRSRSCAFEDSDAAPFYDEYHATVRQFIDEIRIHNGGIGLLYDIHGTAGITGDPAVIFLGTANGESVARLLATDPRALWRPRSLRGFLEAAGHVVSPRHPGVPETPALSGGFTVRNYGSSHADGLDAIQVEITRPLRSDPNLRRPFAEVLAFAIGNLVSRYAVSHTLTPAVSTRSSAAAG